MYKFLQNETGLEVSESGVPGQLAAAAETRARLKPV
jgi:hypothetical protein